MAKASRSMGTLLGFCKSKAKDLDDFLGTLTDRDLTADDIATVKKLRNALEEQFNRTHTKWEALAKADLDPFADDDEYNKCKGVYEKSKVILDKYMIAAKATLDRATTDSTPQTEGGATGSINVKIDELLKPKELLTAEMSLEEADEWFACYKAFLKYNERALNKLDISVKRALLNKYLDTKMSSALRTHKDIVATTPIDAPNGCLEKLRGIFL